MIRDRILGLDLATHTGYSVWDVPGALLMSLGDIDCAIRTPSQSNPDVPGKRFDLLRGYVQHLITQFKITHIFHERSVMGPAAGGAPALISIGMTAIIQQVAFERCVPCVSVSTGTLKKHATGNGGPDTKKQHMIAAAILEIGAARIPLRKEASTKSKPWKYDDDIVDGFWAGHFGMWVVNEVVRPAKYTYSLVGTNTVDVADSTGQKCHVIKV